MERMILPLAFALRCVSLGTTHLTQRFEFTAGRFDIKQLKENLFWYEQSQSIEWTNSTFAGASISPFFLVVISNVQSMYQSINQAFSLTSIHPAVTDDLLIGLLFVIIDLISIALFRRLLERFTQPTDQQTPCNPSSKQSINRHSSRSFILAVFALNPLSLMACTSLSWISVVHCLLLASLDWATRWSNQSINQSNHSRSIGQLIGTSFTLALLVAIDPSFILLVFPIIGLTSRHRNQLINQSIDHSARDVIVSVIAFVVFLLTAIGSAFVSSIGGVKSFAVLDNESIDMRFMTFLQSYAAPYSFHSLTPTIGVMWYFFTQLFDRFHLFFASVFLALPAFLIVAVMSRFQIFSRSISQSLVTVQLSYAIKFLLANHPTVQDLILLAALMCLNNHLMSPYQRSGPMKPALFIVCFALSFQPLMSYLWLGPGSGNANFLYFQCLILNLACAFLLIEYATAARMKIIFEQRQSINQTNNQTIHQSNKQSINDEQQKIVQQ